MKYDPGDLIHLGGDSYLFVTHKYIVNLENRNDWHYLYYDLKKPHVVTPIQADLFDALITARNGIVNNVKKRRTQIL